MKCTSCGAETQGKFCEYCGSEIPQEKANISITNNYYDSKKPDEYTQADNNSGKCPKCGNSKIKFKREQIGTTTLSRSRKNYLDSGRQGQSVSQSAYRTVGVCQSCGYTWNPNETAKASGRKTWLWVLGWLCIFPLPLTILMLRKKDMKPMIRYGIIAVAWVAYFAIGIFGNSGAGASQTGTTTSYYESVQSGQATDSTLSAISEENTIIITTSKPNQSQKTSF